MGCCQEERITKTVARTFSPEFSHHLEFPLQLLWSGGHDDPGSLAQMLETGQAEFEVWHQVPGMVPGQCCCTASPFWVGRLVLG